MPAKAFMSKPVVIPISRARGTCQKVTQTRLVRSGASRLLPSVRLEHCAVVSGSAMAWVKWGNAEAANQISSLGRLVGAA